MPNGLVRTDLNATGVSRRNGLAVTLPLTVGTPISLPDDFGNPIPPVLPVDNTNPVDWVPEASHFGNVITVIN
jgi:hypothetical protein